MSYLHIDNLYKNQDILLFKECYALEKIHGTSAHLTFNCNPKPSVHFSSGGEAHSRFVSLFDESKLLETFAVLALPLETCLKIFGEAYGGRQQGMSSTYGKELRFIVFDVMIGDNWLDVANADDVAKSFGLEFVHYVKVPTELAALDAQRDAPSVQANRNGIEGDKKREGVVLRPLIEVKKNNGSRIIAKHKGDDFRETAKPRPVVDLAKMEVLQEATAIAEEWVTPMRLLHVLDKLPGHCIEKMREIIAAMREDVLREGSGEIVDSKFVSSAIAKKTAELYKQRLNSSIGDQLEALSCQKLNRHFADAASRPIHVTGIAAKTAGQKTRGICSTIPVAVIAELPE